MSSHFLPPHPSPTHHQLIHNHHACQHVLWRYKDPQQAHPQALAHRIKETMEVPAVQPGGETTDHKEGKEDAW